VDGQTDASRSVDDDLDSLLTRGSGQCLEPTLTVPQDWLPPSSWPRLRPRYRVVEDDLGPRIRVESGAHSLHLEEPVRLEGVTIPKPWGREIWLSGMEARGESCVVTPAGRLPLSHYLALAPRRLTSQAPLVLLKILDPRPEPVSGDLYFEVHARKQEVYVVTHLDPVAWPKGAGQIRFGMNQALRGRYQDDAAFRSAYLAAIRAYEQVRRAIDRGEPLPPARETRLREAMESYTAVRELKVGDVVVVPAWLPHSLQHGVRVIEFQTPTYERHIISFAQRVLTQDHWDSEAAVARMSLDPPAEPAFTTVGPDAQRIVNFDDFGVWRVTVHPGGYFDLPAHAPYLLCMTVRGIAGLGNLRLAPEQAAFVPAAALADPARRSQHARVTNRGTEPAVLLIAAPDL
jgi:hypothetical protein